MIRGTVTGNVWSTKQIEGMPRGAFLEIETEGSSSSIIAFDVLGSGLGENVLIATGSVAAAWFPGTPPPIDALIIGSVDEETVRTVKRDPQAKKTCAKK